MTMCKSLWRHMYVSSALHQARINQSALQFEKMLTESGLAPIMTAINDPDGEVRL
jgi:hypothetical protein